MLRKIFDTKKTKRYSDRFKSLIHTLSSMNEQELVKVVSLFLMETAEVTVSTKDSVTVVPLPKEESLDDHIDINLRRMD